MDWNTFFSAPVIWELIICSVFTALFVWRSYSQKSTRLLHWLPSLWTSAGILGTFISIYWGLQNLPGGIALNELINRVVPAFSTSIIGVGMSILISGITKLVDDKLEKEEEDEYKKLTNTESPEALLFQLKQNGIYSEATASEFRRILLEDISSFDGTMSDKFNSVINNLIGIKGFQSTFYDGLKQEFASALAKQNEILEQKQSAQSEFLTNYLNDINESICTHLNQIVEKNNSTYNDLISKLDFSMNSMKMQLTEEGEKRNAEVMSISSHLHEQIDGTVQLLKDSFASYVDTQNEKMQGIHGLITESISNYTQRMEELFLNDIKSIINAFAEQQISESRTILEGIHQEMLTVATDFLNKQTDLSTATTDKLIDSLDHTTDKLSDTIDSMREEISDILKNMQLEQINGINTAMTQTVEDTKAICDTYIANIESVSTSMKDEYSLWIDKMSEHNNAFSTRLSQTENSHIEATATLFRNTESRLEDLLLTINSLAADFNSVATNIQAAMVALGEQTVDDTKTLCEAYQVNLSNIANTMESNFDTFTERMSSSEERLSASISESESNHVERIANLYSNAESSLDDVLFSINNLCNSIQTVSVNIQNSALGLSAQTSDNMQTAYDAFVSNMKSVAQQMISSNANLTDGYNQQNSLYVSKVNELLRSIETKFTALSTIISSVGPTLGNVITNDSKLLCEKLEQNRNEFTIALTKVNDRQLSQIRELHHDTSSKLADEFVRFTNGLNGSEKVTEFEQVCNNLIQEINGYTQQLSELAKKLGKSNVAKEQKKPINKKSYPKAELSSES